MSGFCSLLATDEEGFIFNSIAFNLHILEGDRSITELEDTPATLAMILDISYFFKDSVKALKIIDRKIYGKNLDGVAEKVFSNIHNDLFQMGRAMTASLDYVNLEQALDKYIR